MAKQVTCYIGGEHPTTVLDGFKGAIRDYCAANGLPAPKSEHQMPEEVVPGVVLQEAIASVQSGGAFVTNGLGSFGSKPSEQRERILSLLAKGADVQILGLGRVDGFLHILKSCWEAGAELERQLSELERDYADQEQRLRERMAAFEDKLVARMADVVGQSSVKLFYSNGGTPPAAEVTPTDPTALRVRELREQRGWSMEELTAKAGTNKAMIQRLETRGKGEALGRVMSVLEHGVAA